MLEPPIAFITEDIDFSLIDQDKIKDWLNRIILKHDFELAELTYIFCSDAYLHQINLDYLDHDTYTDIITFNNADEPGLIESDIFISIDRVKENAETLHIPFTDELHRVMVHGILHLLGFDDKTAALKQKMQAEEDISLTLRNF
jgi:probable rRNA maturation factor